MEAALGRSVSKLEVIATEAVAALADGQVELPLLPTTALQVFRAAQLPDSDAATIAKLVQRDQKLAAAVLRVANSPAYSPQCQIDTLQQAAARLGMTVLTEIALAAGMKSSVFDDRTHLQRMQGYWRLSLATALYAKEVARTRRTNVETAYLCGLLHDVGSPIALKSIAVWCSGLESGLNGDEIEWLVDHMAAEVGVFATDKWDLPRPVTEAICHWRDPIQAAHDRDSTTIVACARLLAEHFMLGGEPPNHPNPLFEYLNFYQDEISKLMQMGEQIVASVEGGAG